MKRKELSRRSFLRASIMAAVGIAAASCSQPTPEPAPTATQAPATQAPATQAPATATTAAAPKYQEAPSLAAMVQAGQLPPLEERLPAEPMVVNPVDEVGQYGGRMNFLMDIVNGTNFMNIATYEAMLRWDLNVSSIVPNIVQQWELSPDGKVITFFLRRGIKWSDGAPFTADDVLFWFEDIAGNEDLFPSPPNDAMLVNGQPPQVDKPDDYSFRLTFTAPFGFVLQYMASGMRYQRPKHYLTQFHAEYAEADALNAMVQAADFDSWDQLFSQKDDYYNLQNPDYPVIQAWHPTTPPPSTRYVFQRNPYYWKVDSEGKQLPYIDETVVEILEGAEVVKLRTVAGASDLQYRAIEFGDYPLLMENAEQSGYRVLLYENPRGALPAFMPNQTTNDEVLGPLIRDDRFRIALSHAINREQVNEMVFLGAGKPRQATEASSSPIYKEEWGRAYAEYDPAKANAILDEMGLTERDAEGFRLAANGEPIFILVETPGEDIATTSQVELMKDYWRDIGIKADIENLERGIFRQRVYAGDVVMGCWLLDYVYYPYNPIFTVPLAQNCYWASGYGTWYASGGNEGVEPPPEIRELQDTWDVLKETIDENRQIELFQQLYDNHAQHCWMIGVVGEVPQPIVVNANLGNVPETGIYSWTHGKYVGFTMLEQYYYRS